MVIFHWVGQKLKKLLQRAAHFCAFTQFFPLFFLCRKSLSWNDHAHVIEIPTRQRGFTSHTENEKDISKCITLCTGRKINLFS